MAVSILVYEAGDVKLWTKEDFVAINSTVGNKSDPSRFDHKRKKIDEQNKNLKSMYVDSFFWHSCTYNL